jgi:hypothetical protein
VESHVRSILAKLGVRTPPAHQPLLQGRERSSRT